MGKTTVKQDITTDILRTRKVSRVGKTKKVR